MILEIIGIIVLLFGFVDLLYRAYELAEGSIYLNLKSGDAIVKWQATKTTYYAYLGAKKLHKLSKNIPDANKREMARKYSGEIVKLRKQMYLTVKTAGVNTEAFTVMKEKTDSLYTSYIKSL